MGIESGRFALSGGACEGDVDCSTSTILATL